MDKMIKAPYRGKTSKYAIIPGLWKPLKSFDPNKVKNEDATLSNMSEDFKKEVNDEFKRRHFDNDYTLKYLPTRKIYVAYDKSRHVCYFQAGTGKNKNRPVFLYDSDTWQRMPFKDLTPLDRNTVERHLNKHQLKAVYLHHQAEKRKFRIVDARTNKSYVFKQEEAVKAPGKGYVKVVQDRLPEGMLAYFENKFKHNGTSRNDYQFYHNEDEMKFVAYSRSKNKRIEVVDPRNPISSSSTSDTTSATDYNGYLSEFEEEIKKMAAKGQSPFISPPPVPSKPVEPKQTPPEAVPPQKANAPLKEPTKPTAVPVEKPKSPVKPKEQPKPVEKPPPSPPKKTLTSVPWPEKFERPVPPQKANAPLKNPHESSGVRQASPVKSVQPTPTPPPPPKKPVEKPTPTAPPAQPVNKPKRKIIRTPFSSLPEVVMDDVKGWLAEDGKTLRGMQLFYLPVKNKYRVTDGDEYTFEFEKDWDDQHPPKPASPKKPVEAIPPKPVAQPKPVEPKPVEPKQTPKEAIPPEKANAPLKEPTKPTPPAQQVFKPVAQPKPTPVQVAQPKPTPVVKPKVVEKPILRSKERIKQYTEVNLRSLDAPFQWKLRDIMIKDGFDPDKTKVYKHKVTGGYLIKDDKNHADVIYHAPPFSSTSTYGIQGKQIVQDQNVGKSIKSKPPLTVLPSDKGIAGALTYEAGRIKVQAADKIDREDDTADYLERHKLPVYKLKYGGPIEKRSFSELTRKQLLEARKIIKERNLDPSKVTLEYDPSFHHYIVSDGLRGIGIDTPESIEQSRIMDFYDSLKFRADEFKYAHKHKKPINIPIVAPVASLTYQRNPELAKAQADVLRKFKEEQTHADNVMAGYNMAQVENNRDELIKKKEDHAVMVAEELARIRQGFTGIKTLNFANSVPQEITKKQLKRYRYASKTFTMKQIDEASRKRFENDALRSGINDRLLWHDMGDWGWVENIHGNYVRRYNKPSASVAPVSPVSVSKSPQKSTGESQIISASTVKPVSKSPQKATPVQPATPTKQSRFKVTSKGFSIAPRLTINKGKKTGDKYADIFTIEQIKKDLPVEYFKKATEKTVDQAIGDVRAQNRGSPAHANILTTPVRQTEESKKQYNERPLSHDSPDAVQWQKERDERSKRIAKKYRDSGSSSDDEFDDKSFGEKAQKLNEEYALKKYNDDLNKDYLKKKAREIAVEQLAQSAAQRTSTLFDNVQDFIHFKKAKDARWWEKINPNSVAGLGTGVGGAMMASGIPWVMGGGALVGLGASIASNVLKYNQDKKDHDRKKNNPKYRKRKDAFNLYNDTYIDLQTYTTKKQAQNLHWGQGFNVDAIVQSEKARRRQKKSWDVQKALYDRIAKRNYDRRVSILEAEHRDQRLNEMIERRLKRDASNRIQTNQANKYNEEMAVKAQKQVQRGRGSIAQPNEVNMVTGKLVKPEEHNPIIQPALDMYFKNMRPEQRYELIEKEKKNLEESAYIMGDARFEKAYDNYIKENLLDNRLMLQLITTLRDPNIFNVSKFGTYGMLNTPEGRYIAASNPGLYAGNVERISNNLSFANATKANKDWTRGVIGTGLKWLFDTAITMDPTDLINPGKLWKKGVNFLDVLFKTPTDSKQATIADNAKMLLNERMNVQMAETRKKQQEIAAEAARVAAEEAKKAEEEAEKKYQADLSDYQKEARKSLVKNALIFQDVEDNFANFYSPEGIAKYKQDQLTHALYKQNVEAGKMFPGKDAKFDDYYAKINPEHPSAEIYTALVEGADSPYKNRFLDDVWSQVRGQLNGEDLAWHGVNTKPVQEVYNRGPDFKKMNELMKDMKKHDPRTYLATFHPEILQEALNDPTYARNKGQIDRILKMKANNISQSDDQMLKDEFDYIAKQHGFTVKQPVTVKDKDNNEAQIKGDPKTPLLNQAEFNGILFTDADEMFPNIPNKEKPAAYVKAAMKYHITPDNIKYTGTEDDYTSNYVNMFVKGKPSDKLLASMRMRGLEKQEDWDERLKASNLWIQMNMKPEEITADNVTKIRNNHFAMTKKDFENSVRAPMRKQVFKDFGKKLEDAWDLGKQLLKEKREIEQLKFEASKNQLESLMDRITDRTARGDVERYLKDRKDEMGFLELDKSDPFKYEQELVRYAEPLHIVDELFQTEVAHSMENNFLSPKDRNEFDMIHGNKIMTMVPQNANGIPSKEWKEFDSKRLGKKVKFDLFDMRSYLRDDEDDSMAIRHTDPNKVAWGAQQLQHYLGFRQAWAAGNRKMLTTGYGHEENLVDGAGHQYAGQRARRLAAMSKDITDKIYKDEEYVDTWTDDDGLDDEQKRIYENIIVPFKEHRTVNRKHEAGRLKFAINHMINRYGDEVADEIYKAGDPKFLTVPLIKEFETAWTTGAPFDLRARVKENEDMFKLTMEGLKRQYSDKKYKILTDERGNKRFITNPEAPEWKDPRASKEINVYKSYRAFNKDDPKRERGGNLNKTGSNGFDAVNTMYQSLTKGRRSFKLGYIRGVNKEYDFDQLPAAASLEEDPNFIQSVLKERLYRGMNHNDLDVAIKKYPGMMQGVKETRQLYKMTAIFGHKLCNKPYDEQNTTDILATRFKAPFNTKDSIAKKAIRVLMAGTGRNPNYQNTSEDKQLIDQMKFGKVQSTRATVIDPTTGMRLYPPGLKVDMNNPAYQREVRFSFLSKERSKDAARPPLQKAIKSVTFREPEKGLENPILQRYQANEENIDNVSMLRTGVNSPYYGSIGDKGNLATNSKGWGNAQTFERRAERQEKKVEDSNNDDEIEPEHDDL